jgi:hypothetical protein
MWGDNLRLWFDLFAGMVVYRGGQQQSPEEASWLNVKDIEGRFKRENLTFHGSKYNPSNLAQRNALLDAIISNASALCYVKLLERRRQIYPPSLDYRVSKLGRIVDRWRHRTTPGIRKRIFFFAVELFFRLKRYWKVIAIGATGWTILNAVKFYSAAWAWVSNDIFAAISAAVVAAIIGLVHLFFRIVGSAR